MYSDVSFNAHYIPSFASHKEGHLWGRGNWLFQVRKIYTEVPLRHRVELRNLVGGDKEYAQTTHIPLSTKKRNSDQLTSHSFFTKKLKKRKKKMKAAEDEESCLVGSLRFSRWLVAVWQLLTQPDWLHNTTSKSSLVSLSFNPQTASWLEIPRPQHSLPKSQLTSTYSSSQ